MSSDLDCRNSCPVWYIHPPDGSCWRGLLDEGKTAASRAYHAKEGLYAPVTVTVSRNTPVPKINEVWERIVGRPRRKNAVRQKAHRERQREAIHA